MKHLHKILQKRPHNIRRITKKNCPDVKYEIMFTSIVALLFNNWNYKVAKTLTHRKGAYFQLFLLSPGKIRTPTPTPMQRQRQKNDNENSDIPKHPKKLNGKKSGERRESAKKSKRILIF